MLKQFGKTADAFIAYQTLALVIQTGARDDISRAIQNAQRKVRGRQARAMLARLSRLVATDAPQYSIFATHGNAKLPFVAFSSLPGVTCPGAGECINHCYSFNAWRFPHAFGRQAHNAYLMRFNRAAITGALDEVRAKLGDTFDLRLYVDGDFSSAGDVDFWTRALIARPAIRAYGYSKSFHELLAHDRNSGGMWPANYLLNLSNGHAHNSATVDAIKTLPVYRGEFRAVSIGRRVRSAEHGTREVNAALRAASTGKVFTCPGKCGSCVPHGHACGSDRFRSIPIVIAIH